ncbi:SDR family NAD(P)-dependent oxidoreductase [Pseudoxanthomonas daejeonensis]|uniref:SDR family NAD(P)-dependent oxidoreductase n=1 Tax=Pseudoxanthomonas daejeonensis TaxID=266062 RepID=UPI003CE4E0CA
MSGMLSPETLVLGASGRVGSGVVAALLEAGSPVLAVGRDDSRLQALAQMHADEPALELLAGSVATDREAARLAAQVAERPRRLRAVIDTVAGPRRSARLLDRRATFLRHSLDRGLLPHLAAARHLLPLLANDSRQGEVDAARYLLIGGPQAECGWAGYGHASITGAALRMLAKVLHEEALPLGIRLQLLAVDAPVWDADNASSACSGWHAALAVGRSAVSLVAGSGRPDCIVACSARDAIPASPLLARDFAQALQAAAGTHDGGRAAA